MGFQMQINSPGPKHRGHVFFPTAGGVQLPQRLNKPLKGTGNGRLLLGSKRGGKAFACERREVGKTGSAPGSVLSTGACCTDGC